MHLLIVEDDALTASGLAHDLAQYGHSTVIARDGRDALFYVEDEHFDAIILDRMLPLLDGIEVLKRLRNRDERIPILMLTALGDLTHRVEGLDGGADDYLVKPAAIPELNARLRSIARRSTMPLAATTLKLNDIELDVLRQVVRQGDHSASLQQIEFRILRDLMLHAGKVVTRKMLLESVWGYHFDPGSNIVDLHIHKTRAKLRHHGIVDLIKTVRGIGYCIEHL